MLVFKNFLVFCIAPSLNMVLTFGILKKQNKTKKMKCKPFPEMNLDWFSDPSYS